MEELQKLLPLLSFLGTICTAITVAILIRASVDRITQDIVQLKKDFQDYKDETEKRHQDLRERLLKQEVTCTLLHKPPEHSSGEYRD